MGFRDITPVIENEMGTLKQKRALGCFGLRGQVCACQTLASFALVSFWNFWIPLG